MNKGIKKKTERIPLPMKLLSSFHIEADRALSGIVLSFGGVKSIEEYSETNIKLFCGFVRVYLRGTALSISFYENKTVEISGKVEVIELVYSSR